MSTIYEDVTPAPIDNVTVKKSIYNGIHKAYTLKANEGYVLHDNTLDIHEYNDDYTEIIKTTLGYSEGTKTCGANYDWEANPREFYAVKKGVETDG